MENFTATETVDTWNGVATAHISSKDTDRKIDLINGKHFLSVSDNGDVEILGKATDGMFFRRGFMTFPTEEVKHNYLVDFSV